MTTLLTVPTLDLSAGASAHNVETLGRGLKDFGFVNVINHGVSPIALARAYDVSAQTFALPLDVKQKYENAADGRATGYISPKVEKAVGAKVPDLKEFWHIRRNVAPDRLRFPTEIPDFGPAAMALTDELDVLAVKLLALLETYLSLPTGTLTGMVRDGASLLRWLHYFALDGNEEGERAGAHTDINFITLLPAATSAGLEVQTRDGIWIPINNPPNSIIVNAGDMLMRYTLGLILSTLHRVVNLDGKARYSMPYFVHARGEVLIQTNPPLTADEYLNERLREIGLLT